MNHENVITTLYLLDFQPPPGGQGEAEQCFRCGFRPDLDLPRPAILELDLWDAPGLAEPCEVADDGFGNPVLVWADGQELTEKDVTWVVLCGVCLRQLPRQRCQALCFEPAL